jgi:hypothetical protein
MLSELFLTCSLELFTPKPWFNRKTLQCIPRNTRYVDFVAASKNRIIRKEKVYSPLKSPWISSKPLKALTTKANTLSYHHQIKSPPPPPPSKWAVVSPSLVVFLLPAPLPLVPPLLPLLALPPPPPPLLVLLCLILLEHEFSTKLELLNLLPTGFELLILFPAPPPGSQQRAKAQHLGSR